MVDAKKPVLGTWASLPVEQVDRKPKVTFESDVPVTVTFQSSSPREYQGDDGVFYVFDVMENKEQKVVVTSAWTLLRGLKTLTPLAGKTVKIVKAKEKGKHNFTVEEIKA